MSGILVALASSSGGLILTVGSSTFETTEFTYSDGYVDGGRALVTSDFIGGLSPATVNGAQVVALYWSSTISHESAFGSVRIEVQGNRSSGFISQLSCDGVSLGAIGAPNYDAGYNTTQFAVGGTMANPFGTSGTKRIDVS